MGGMDLKPVFNFNRIVAKPGVLYCVHIIFCMTVHEHMPYDTVEVENELKASTSAVRALNPMLFVGYSCDITSMGNNHVSQLRNVGNTLHFYYMPIHAHTSTALS